MVTAVPAIMWMVTDVANMETSFRTIAIVMDLTLKDAVNSL